MVNDMATEGGKAVATDFANRAVAYLINKARENGEKNTIESGAAFEMYLYNAYNALNWKRTLASGYESLCIIGKEKNMYVDIGAYYTTDHTDYDVDTSSVESILSANDREDKIIIDGTGGAGKSMLMRYLFVDTVFRNAGNYVPVYMELTKIKANSMHEMDIRAFVRQSMDNYGKISLSDTVFDYSLEQGGYVFLFDGFDEVKEEDADEVLDALQKFSAKYSNNAFIISSRERLRLRSLSSFQIIHTKKLSESKAIELAQKFSGHPDIISEFCKNLKDGWFQEYNEFTASPLLLTMMFITFEQNGDISNCLPDFYQDCFDALYNKHDAVHKVGFNRTFHCNSKREFQNVFSYFCFHTWRQEIYDFSEDEMLEWLEKSLKKQNLSVSAEDYLKDLTESLCMITYEGHRYRFAHRSFQTYFAAKYTRTLSDQQQKEFLTDKFNWDSNTYWNDDYLDLLNQVDHDRFLSNLIEPTFQNIISEYHSEQMFFQHILSYSDIEIFSTPINQYILPESKYDFKQSQVYSRHYLYSDIEIGYIPTETIYILNIEHPLPNYSHLLSYINYEIAYKSSSVEKLIFTLLPKYSKVDLTTLENGISLRDLLHSDNVSEDDKHILSNCILDAFQAHEIYQAITDWLAEREEAARQKPGSDDKFADY